MQPERIVIYTAITAGKDFLHPPMARLAGVEYVCFTDDILVPNGFEIRKLPFSESHPQLSARKIKLFPHLLFPNHTVSLWVDGSRQITGDLTPLLEAGLTRDMALLTHPDRNCLYDEAEHCAQCGRADPSVLRAQAQHYREQQMQEQAGLFHTGMLLRRHHVPEVKAAMELWWNEISNHSLRDQVSLPYVLWKTGLAVEKLDYQRWHNRCFFDYGHRFYPPLDDRNRLRSRWQRTLAATSRRLHLEQPYRALSRLFSASKA